ncbi:MAG TPA: VOC family protein [Myxococcaceae bacterium]|nr:VOC family protein [Myxococcaceae bacterium]
MAKSTKPVPEGLRSLTPQIVVNDAAAALELYQRAFGAEVMGKMTGPDGKSVMHSHVRIGDSVLFVASAGFAPPTHSNNFLYVPDVDAVFARATAAGFKVLAPVADMFWGDRWGQVQDPYGNAWQLATHVEDVSPEEMQRRAKQAAPPK